MRAVRKLRWCVRFPFLMADAGDVYSARGSRGCSQVAGWCGRRDDIRIGVLGGGQAGARSVDCKGELVEIEHIT